MNQDDPEAELRALWTARGVPKARQDAIIAEVAYKASPAYLARLFPPEGPPAPFASEPTDQGNQLVIPGCEKDRTRGPQQGDLF